jgi:hypothetical protein
MANTTFGSANARCNRQPLKAERKQRRAVIYGGRSSQAAQEAFNDQAGFVKPRGSGSKRNTPAESSIIRHGSNGACKERNVSLMSKGLRSSNAHIDFAMATPPS